MKRKEELEELLQDMEQRIDDGEAQITAAAAEKKKLLTNVQDLEDQYVHVVTPKLYQFSPRGVPAPRAICFACVDFFLFIIYF